MIKLFIQNSASFDFAYLTKKQGPLGKSFYVDVTFEGKTNRKGMIIDFSYAKTAVKSIIEDFDHKLLVSARHIKHKTPSHFIVCTASKIIKSFKCAENERNVFFAMYARKNWIKMVTPRILKLLENDSIAEFEQFIAKIILKSMPKNISNVCVKLKESTDPVVKPLSSHGSELSPRASLSRGLTAGTTVPNSAARYPVLKARNENDDTFHYTHTLCYHVGNCQRFHGHSAQIRIFQNKIFNSNLSAEFAKKIKGLYIISSRHTCPLFNSAHLEKIKEYCFPKKTFEKMQPYLNAFEYQGSQGKVSIMISKHLSLILQEESTIENITRYIHAQIPNNSLTEVHVYEGLSKGAIVG